MLDETNLQGYKQNSEEELLEKVAGDFRYKVRERGEDYYDSGNVEFCCKNGGKYYAKVRSANEHKYYTGEPRVYKVSVEVTGDEVKYECNCPCDFPCKHIYAVLLAIVDREYVEAELKPEVKARESKLTDVLRRIPAEEIKAYLLSPEGSVQVQFGMTEFAEHFRKYYPRQSYEYYYNNLYNALVMDADYAEMTEAHLEDVQQYIAGQEFGQSFKILRSVIMAYGDAGKLELNEIVRQFPVIGMLLRITWRKGGDEIRVEIGEWARGLQERGYLGSLYLEDAILMMGA